MKWKPEVFQASVVCVGAFNPPIISPEWLNRHNLIGIEDAEQAHNAPSLLISPQVSQFETSWFGVQVVENQFTVNSKGVVTGALKDLVVGILTLLPQTPISAMGINFMAHYKTTLEEHHRLGDVLAPKPIWNKLVKKEGFHAGLASLTMQIMEMNREKLNVAKKDMINITVQPSTVFQPGLFLAYNDHRNLTVVADDERQPAERAVAILDNEWESIDKEAKEAFSVVIEDGLAAATEANG